MLHSTAFTSEFPYLNDQSLYSIACAAKGKVRSFKKNPPMHKENGEFGKGSIEDVEHHVSGDKEVPTHSYKVPNPLETQNKEMDLFGNIGTGHKSIALESQVGKGFSRDVEHHVTGTKEVNSLNYLAYNPLDIQSKAMDFLRNIGDGSFFNSEKNPQLPKGYGDASRFEVGQGSTRLFEDHVTDNDDIHLCQVPTTFVEDHITLSGEEGVCTSQILGSLEIQRRGTDFVRNANDGRESLDVDTEICLDPQGKNMEDISSTIKQSYRLRKRLCRAKMFGDIHATVTENNGAQIIKERKGRGWTGYKSIKPPLGKTHHDCWTLQNVLVGNEGGTLTRFLGLKARETDSFPLHLHWSDLQDKSFLSVWVEVQKLFKFKSCETKLTPNIYCVMKWCEARVQTSVITYRSNLKRWLRILSPEELQLSPESRISQEQWRHLLIYWSKEETQLVAEQNATNRANIRPTFTLGTKSMRRKQFELMMADLNASEYHTYIISHKNKKGEFPNEDTKTMMEEIEAEAERRNVQDSHNPLEFLPVMDHVYGNPHGGYQRGYGHGVTRKLLKEAPMMELAQQTYQEIEKEASFHAQALADAKRRMATMMGKERSISSHARGSNSEDDGPNSQAEHSNNIGMGSNMQNFHID